MYKKEVFAAAVIVAIAAAAAVAIFPSGDPTNNSLIYGDTIFPKATPSPRKRTVRPKTIQSPRPIQSPATAAPGASRAKTGDVAMEEVNLRNGQSTGGNGQAPAPAGTSAPSANRTGPPGPRNLLPHIEQDNLRTSAPLTDVSPAAVNGPASTAKPKPKPKRKPKN